MVNINEEDYYSGKYKTIFADLNLNLPFAEAELVGANILAQHEDESCIYLKENKCSIHKDRPRVCRAFFCESKDPEFKEMVIKVNEYKRKHGIRVHK